MRRGIFTMVCAAVAITGAGCATPCASTGWRFEVLKPPTVSNNALVASGPAPLGIAGLGTGGIYHEVAAIGPTAPAVIAGRPLAASASNCTLDDICRKLDALAASMQRSLPRTSPELLTPPRPMPRGEPVAN